MAFFKKKGWKKFLALPLLVFLLFLLISPSALEASCARALAKCGVSALLIGLGNAALGAGWAAGCMIGFVWCLEFF